MYAPFDYQNYMNPTEICISCIDHTNLAIPFAIDQCIRSLKKIEILSMAIFNLDIYTEVNMGALIINMVDFSNCYSGNTVDVLYDHTTSTLTVESQPTKTCSILTRSKLAQISLILNLSASSTYYCPTFNISRFGFNSSKNAISCTDVCRRSVFEFMEQPKPSGLFILDFKNSIYGGIMSFPVNRVSTDWGKMCFQSLFATVSPGYVGLSLRWRQLQECNIIGVSNDDMVHLQVFVIDDGNATSSVLFTWEEKRKFSFLTKPCYLFSTCHRMPDSSSICNYLTQLVQQGYNLHVDVVLSFRDPRYHNPSSTLVLRYPVETIKPSVWDFANAYVSSSSITFVTQHILRIPVSTVFRTRQQSTMHDSVQVDLLLQDQRTFKLTLILSTQIKVAELLQNTFVLSCDNPNDSLASVCLAELSNVRKDPEFYTLLLNFIPMDFNEIDSSYLVYFISINPIWSDMLWQMLLLFFATCAYIVIIILGRCICDKIRLT